MNKILLLIFSLAISTFLISQSTDKMSYQAVVRDIDNNLVTNSSVGMRISILKESIAGTVVYEEIQTLMTNVNGLLSTEIGGGAGYDTINWGNNQYFLRTEIDPTGGTNYTIAGTTQLLSVPYALHANTAENIRGGHYVGELYGGGVVFWVNADRSHGLIVSLDDLDGGNGVEWGLYGINVPNCESMTDGKSNTSEIISAGGDMGDAAGLCYTYTAEGYNDWYLPSTREFTLLISQDIMIDNLLDNDGDPNTNGFSQEAIPAYLNRYWGSTESAYNSEEAMYFSTYGGYSGTDDKTLLYRVRAIRAF